MSNPEVYESNRIIWGKRLMYRRKSKYKGSEGAMSMVNMRKSATIVRLQGKAERGRRRF